MIQLAICDDEVKELERTCAMAEAYRAARPELELSLRKFASSYNLLDAIHARGRFDIYLLDILMPELGGIEVGTAIRQRDSAAILIYLTSSPDFALESYSVEAQGYLLKPFEQSALFAALDKALARLDAENQKRLLLQTPGGGIEGVPYSRIVWLEYYQHRLIAHTTDGERVESIVYREPFEQLVAPLMADSRFLKISISLVVNMQHVRGMTFREARLANGERLKISRSCPGARQAYLNYILEKGG